MNFDNFKHKLVNSGIEVISINQMRSKKGGLSDNYAIRIRMKDHWWETTWFSCEELLYQTSVQIEHQFKTLRPMFERLDIDPAYANEVIKQSVRGIAFIRHPTEAHKRLYKLVWHL